MKGYFGIVNRCSGRLITVALAAALLALAMACGGCWLGSTPATQPASSKPVEAARAPGKSEAVQRAVTFKEWGNTAICPVTGETFAIDERSFAAEFRGQTFHFRDEAALKAFLAAPEGYQLDSLAAPAKPVK